MYDLCMLLYAISNNRQIKYIIRPKQGIVLCTFLDKSDAVAWLLKIFHAKLMFLSIFKGKTYVNFLEKG